ncbi:MAG: GNAT family N-acetyltransferase [Pseudomonadota bacterium]
MTFREAVEGDVAAIVALLADDPLGAQRERVSEPVDPVYLKAFRTIADNPHDRLIVGEVDGAVAACAQLTILNGLSRQGMRRGIIEGVRVASHLRGSGAGAALIDHCAALARAAGCGMVQLTSDRTRTRAIAFYERIGFEHSHAGLKQML